VAASRTVTTTGAEDAISTSLRTRWSCFNAPNRRSWQACLMPVNHAQNVL
jgi:hypothetical protein